MFEYVYLTSNIQVPREWQIEVARSIITAIVKDMISVHRQGIKVVMTIQDVAALITNNMRRPGYRLEKIKEINDENIFRLDLILPIKTVLVMPRSRNCVLKEEEESLQAFPMKVTYDHPISQMFGKDPHRHRFMTAAPDLKKVLELKGIKSPDMFNCTLQTTYRISKINPLTNIELQGKSSQSNSTGFSMTTEQVADNKWDVVCFDGPLLPE